MVVYFHNNHAFSHSFETVTLAYFNRYPNPYSKHVKSIDTIDCFTDSAGRLHQTKLIRKVGRMPGWAKPFLGKVNTSWIVEKTTVDPKALTLTTYNCNLDHTKLLRVEESTKYTYNDESGQTDAELTVRFSSGFKRLPGLNIRSRIENWSKTRFAEHSQGSRDGLKLVMEAVRQRLNSPKVAGRYEM